MGIESTIVDFSQGYANLLRPGAVTLEELLSALGQPVMAQARFTAVRAPGMLRSHYAPKAQVILVDAADLSSEWARLREAGKRVAILAAAHALRDWVRTRTAGPLLLGITAAAPVCLFFAASYFLEVGSHWVTGAWVAALVGLATTWHTLELGPRGRRLRNWSLGFAVGLTGFMQIVVPALPVISPAIAALKWSWVGQQDRIITCPPKRLLQ